MLRARRRTYVIVAATALCAVLAIPWALFSTARHVPAFYRQALASNADERRRASDDLLRRASDLTNIARRERHWSGRFTDDQVNGWLAVDMVENHPELLPNEFSEPRVTIENDGLRIGCRYKAGGISTILSLHASAYLVEPNLLAIRLHGARAGALPLPLGRILEQISTAANDMDLRLTWRQVDGDPVALVELSSLGDDDTALVVESLELGEGSFYVAGRSEPRTAEQTARREAVQPLQQSAGPNRQR